MNDFLVLVSSTAMLFNFRKDIVLGYLFSFGWQIFSETFKSNFLKEYSNILRSTRR